MDMELHVDIEEKEVLFWMSNSFFISWDGDGGDIVWLICSVVLSLLKIKYLLFFYLVQDVQSFHPLFTIFISNFF